jgi:hypothetical protein
VTRLLGLLLVDCATTQAPELREPPVTPSTEVASAPLSRPTVTFRPVGQLPDGTSVQRPTSASAAPVDPACTLDADERKAGYAEVIKRRIVGLEICYESALRKDRRLTGKLTYTIHIAPVGDVSRVDIDDDTVHNEDLLRCTVAKIQAWHFEPTCVSEPRDVTFSVTFTG